MRPGLGATLALWLVALIAVGAPQASGRAQDLGRLSGVTQISYGCPGPQREGEPCERWSTFAHAQFRLAKLSSGGATRTITSDLRGRFTLVLAVGRYRLTPLPQAHASRGTPITLMIHVAATTWARVRFQGVPRML